MGRRGRTVRDWGGVSVEAWVLLDSHIVMVVAGEETYSRLGVKFV